MCAPDELAVLRRERHSPDEELRAEERYAFSDSGKGGVLLGNARRRLQDASSHRPVRHGTQNDETEIVGIVRDRVDSFVRDLIGEEVHPARESGSAAELQRPEGGEL